MSLQRAIEKIVEAVSLVKTEAEARGLLDPEKVCTRSVERPPPY